MVSPGTSTPVTPPAFAYSNGNRLPDGAWMRIALTKEQVASTNWDGTGEFSAGEIEDHFIELPDTGDKQVPILTVECNGPYRFGDANQINVQCTITNLHPTAGGNFTYRLDHIGAGSVGVGNCLPPGPVFINAAADLQVICTATKGDLPDTWRFVAIVQDPVFIITPGGGQIGHSDESTADFDFTANGEKQRQAFVNSLVGSFQHFSGFSVVRVSGAIYYDDPEPLPGAEVSLEMTGPSTETTMVTTDENGEFDAEFTIFQFGTYTVEVTGITGENVEYVPENDVISSTTVIVQ